MGVEQKLDIAAWIKDCIEGKGGMNAYEDNECVVWHVPERQAAATWILRCLANPWCEGSEAVLAAILERRPKKMREAAHAR